MYNASIIQYLSMFSSIWIIILFQISKSFKLFIFILLSLYCNELTFVHAQSTECLSMSVTVIDGNFAPDIFDGVYRLTNETTFNRPKWTVPQSSNDKTISYFFTSQWIINGLGNNILSYSSTDNLPPINDSNAEWSHSSISGTYHVMMRCILSYSPTLSPSLIPSLSPTHRPTISPTLQCSTLFVNISDGNGFNQSDFDGLYTYSDMFSGRPRWEVPQAPNDKHIYHISGQWIIDGYVEILTHLSNSFLPPINNLTSEWIHSAVPGIFHIDISCINSFSPTTSPTLSPSPSPTNVPTNVPTFSPSINPTAAPTITPSHAPTTAPSIAPSLNPTLTPTHAPSFNPSFSPTIAPTVLPTANPSNSPT
eukprot:50586_1